MAMAACRFGKATLAGRLGADDAGDYFGRNLRRNFHPDRGFCRGRVLRVGRRHVDLPRDQASKPLHHFAQIGDVSSAVIMFIIANAGLFAFLITRAGVPDAIGHWSARDVLKSPAYFLLA